MAIYEYREKQLEKASETKFKSLGIKERSDLQRLLRDQIEVVAPDCLVIGEEFGDWVDSSRRIDLLAIDRDANLVVIELKRTEDGGHMELQSLRYAAMVSTMTFERAVKVFEDYLETRGIEQNAEKTILSFLGWDNSSDEEFGNDVKIILVSADFSIELTGTVLWLSQRDIDIRCVRIKPYIRNEQILLDVQQIIPLPEAEEYQVRIREKRQKERSRVTPKLDYTKYDLTVGDVAHTALAKRHVVYHAVKYLHDEGIPIDEIADAYPPRSKRLFFSIDGETQEKSVFIKMAVNQRDEIGKDFRPKRHYCDDGEFLVQEGRTYAVLNQWGAESMRGAIQSFQSAFPKLPISISATE